VDEWTRIVIKAGEALLSFNIDSWQNGVNRNVEAGPCAAFWATMATARISGGRRMRSPKRLPRNSRSVKVGKSDYERDLAERAQRRGCGGSLRSRNHDRVASSTPSRLSFLA